MDDEPTLPAPSYDGLTREQLIEALTAATDEISRLLDEQRVLLQQLRTAEGK